MAAGEVSRQDQACGLTPAAAVAAADAFVGTIGTYPEGRYAGRGVVVCGGGFRYGPCAWVLVRLLRHLGCTLPVEVWHLGGAERNAEWERLLAEHGAGCVDATSFLPRHPHPDPGGWALKPYAVLHSRFREVLLLDADNVPVLDPSYLFDSPEYQETGAVFWPDVGRAGPDSPYWRVFGVGPRDEPEQESGQVLVDKRRCWRALGLCDWYNRNRAFYYRYVYGDKDTFRLAWHRLGAAYAMPPRGIEFIPHTLCQHDFAGRRVFQHRVGDKWSLAAGGSGNRRVPGFAHEDLCLSFLAELREQCPPVTWLAPHLGAADRAAMAGAAGRPLRLVRPGHGAWPAQLAADGSLAAGASDDLCFWWADPPQPPSSTPADDGDAGADDGDAAASVTRRPLVVAGRDGRVTARLDPRPGRGGGWAGDSLRHPGMRVELHPAGPA